MAPRARALTPESLGAWVLKTNPRQQPVGELVRSGFRTVTARCVRPTYRADLIAAGQPVLLWVSGGDPSIPAGIYAQGRTTGAAEPGSPELTMPVELGPVEPPVLRAELVEHPLLGQIEVLKMAAGSNPSFITREGLRELTRRWPQVTVG
ncbi:hypothetical protein [Nocardioides antri]|uniref:EVE domain-containing protein n=1 Tax=Nocardioides antri TaxID=2607659 RepID=A0A5B1M1N9_9ACTN|nr:hypothetical protein [Nocardioides antri]KAA1426566.1 hypothetical protein F0U47_14350 [Nocardioides antri]